MTRRYSDWGYGGGSYSGDTPSAQDTTGPDTNVGKFGFDTTDPIGSVEKIGAQVFGGIGAVPIVGDVARGALDLAGNAAGKVGDIGVGGFGVKQTLGAAGDVLSAPEKFVESQVGQSRIHFAQGKASPFDWLVRGVTEIPQGPLALATDLGIELPSVYGLAQDVVAPKKWDYIPPDLKARLDNGEDPQKIANELADRGAGFSPNPLPNMLESIVLDPMNLASAGAGKVLTRAASFGDIARDIDRGGKSAEEVNGLVRVTGRAYNLAARGLPAAGAATMEKLLGQATNGTARAFPKIVKHIGYLRASDPAAADALEEAAGFALKYRTDVVAAQQIAEDLRAKVGTAFTVADRRKALDLPYNTDLAMGTGRQFDDRVAENGISHYLDPTDLSEPAMRAEVIKWTALASGTTEDRVIAAFAKAGVSRVDKADWRAARELYYGRSLEAVGKLRPARIKNEAGEYEEVLHTLISPDTMDAVTGRQYLQRMAIAASGQGKTARKAGVLRLQKINDEFAAAVARAKDLPETEQEAARQVAFRQREEALGKLKTQEAAVGKDEYGRVIEDPAVTEALGAAGQPSAKEVATAEQRSAVAREAVEKYAELRNDMKHLANVEGREWTADDVEKWLRANIESMPRVWALGPEAEDVAAKLALGENGYRVGFEPSSGWKVALVDGEYIPVRPFVPLPTAGLEFRHRNALGEVYDQLFGAISQVRIIYEAQDRFVQRMSEIPGITADESRAVFQAILHTAYDEGTTPRAAFKQFDKVFRSVLSDAGMAKVTERYSPAFLVNYAFEGNLGTVGLTQKMTGRIKTLTSGLGNVTVKIAEDLYPSMKFKNNPLFWTQEVIESPFWNIARGVSPTKTGATREYESIYDAFIKNKSTRYVYEAGVDTQLAGAVASHRLIAPFEAIADRLPTTWPAGVTKDPLPGLGKGLANYKEQRALALARQLHGARFEEALRELQPDAWDRWVAKVGDDPARIVEEVLKERMAMAAGPQSLGVVLAGAEAAGGLDAGAETVWQAWKWALKQGSDEAFKVHFFNPQRGWLERTLNHPYLGLYPLSYMWGKVVPEFSRFLFLEPFGAKAPLAGYNAYKHVQQQIMVMSQDPEFAKQLQANKGAIYLVQYMLPGLPNDVPVNAPAWMRHFAQGQSKTVSGYSPKGWKGQKGYGPYDPAAETNDLVTHIGILNAPRLISEGIGPGLAAISDTVGQELGAGGAAPKVRSPFSLPSSR